MSHCRVWQQPDGSLRITYPKIPTQRADESYAQFLARMEDLACLIRLKGESESAYVQRVLDRIPSQDPTLVGLPSLDVEVHTLPHHKDPNLGTFRSCYRVRDGAVVVDPVLETAERWGRVRTERDRRLAESDSMMARANEQNSRINEWKTYRQALRDVPLQADPKAITWPMKPA